MVDDRERYVATGPCGNHTFATTEHNRSRRAWQHLNVDCGAQCPPCHLDGLCTGGVWSKGCAGHGAVAGRVGDDFSNDGVAVVVGDVGVDGERLVCCDGRREWIHDQGRGQVSHHGDGGRVADGPVTCGDRLASSRDRDPCASTVDRRGDGPVGNREGDASGQGHRCTAKVAHG